MSLILLIITCNTVNANDIKHDLLVMKKAYTNNNLNNPRLSVNENCLAKTIYYEARGSSLDEKILVGIVAINRSSNRKNICQVISQKHQFSWYSKSKKTKIHEKNAWDKSVIIAKVLNTHKKQIMSNIKYFHSKKMRKPKWSRKMRISAIGTSHLYY